MFGLFGKLKGYAIGALAAIASILFALVYGFTKGRNSGEATVNAKNAQTTIEAVETRNEVQSEVTKQAAGSAEKALKDKWSRD
jgi:hypothetical protein